MNRKPLRLILAGSATCVLCNMIGYYNQMKIWLQGYFSAYEACLAEVELMRQNRNIWVVTTGKYYGSDTTVTI